MNSYNLYSPNGVELNYPHYTKFGRSEVLVITTTDKLVEVGDEVFVATETRTPEG